MNKEQITARDLFEAIIVQNKEHNENTKKMKEQIPNETKFSIEPIELIELIGLIESIKPIEPIEPIESIESIESNNLDSIRKETLKVMQDACDRTRIMLKQKLFIEDITKMKECRNNRVFRNEKTFFENFEDEILECTSLYYTHFSKYVSGEMLEIYEDSFKELDEKVRSLVKSFNFNNVKIFQNEYDFNFCKEFELIILNELLHDLFLNFYKKLYEKIKMDCNETLQLLEKSFV